MENEREVIAFWGLSNVASLNVYEIESDEAMLVGINDDEPEWVRIEFHVDPEAPEDDENDVMSGITFGGSFYRINQCMKHIF